MKGMKRMLGRAKVELHAKREPYMQRVCLPRKVVAFLGSKGGDDVFYFEDKRGLVVIMSQRQLEERSSEDERTPRFSRGTGPPVRLRVGLSDQEQEAETL
ncbi:MAG: hypothetical protein PHZ19_00300 [Candidatus Thermoplasmatota archaeon]|nr:hypothetical protein [Candidatus Thermoplasmatota archaeon]